MEDLLEGILADLMKSIEDQQDCARLIPIEKHVRSESLCYMTQLEDLMDFAVVFMWR